MVTIQCSTKLCGKKLLAQSFVLYNILLSFKYLLFSITHCDSIDFMHYRYHCHTCKLVDGTGVCTVCAKVCHKGHELSYSKCGSFFCDCGAKEDKSCQALVKRGAGTAASGSKATSASEDSQSFAVPFGSSTTKKTKKSNL